MFNFSPSSEVLQRYLSQLGGMPAAGEKVPTPPMMSAGPMSPTGNTGISSGIPMGMPQSGPNNIGMIDVGANVGAMSHSPMLPPQMSPMTRPPITNRPVGITPSDNTGFGGRGGFLGGPGLRGGGLIAASPSMRPGFGNPINQTPSMNKGGMMNKFKTMPPQSNRMPMGR